MRNTLIASVAALGLAIATPAFADTGNAPNIPASAGNHAATVQTGVGAHIVLTGGDYFGDQNEEYHQQPQRVADGGDWGGVDNQEYNQPRRVADGGGTVSDNAQQLG